MALGAGEAEIAAIETVDVVGDASRLQDLLEGQGYRERFDWIVSSHNFEHLADRVGFLCAGEGLLSPGGLTGLIIPDKRYTFDRFQGPSPLAALLRAGDAVVIPPEECVARRSALCRQIEDEAATVTGHCLRLERELASARAELTLLRAELGRQRRATGEGTEGV